MKAWSPIRVGSLTVPNRFVYTATGEGMATPQGDPTPRLRERYRSLGCGGAVGMMVTGHVYVMPEGKMRDGQMGLYDDKQIKGYAVMAKAAKSEGSRFFLQLAHGGIMTMREVTGKQAAGPSRMTIKGSDDNRAMSLEEIQALPGLYAQAARRAREAGCDGVQLHAAHGYGLCQFLSPFYNQREDEYGGSPAKRARLLVEVLKAVREAAGTDFPVTAKINGEDFMEGGLRLEDAVSAARLLEEAGLDGVEVSGGSCVLSPPRLGPMRPAGSLNPDGPGYFIEQTRAFKQALNIPVTLVGGIRSPEQAEKVLEEGSADQIGICRPLIREPDLLLRWSRGQFDRPGCVSCNRCIDISRSSAGVHCPMKL